LPGIRGNKDNYMKRVLNSKATVLVPGRIGIAQITKKNADKH